jgi:hypothetical protein
MDLKHCYALLELKAGATSDDARRAYKRQVKIWHPDRFSPDSVLKGQADEQIKSINLAYEQICRHLSQTSDARPSVPPSSPQTPPPAALLGSLERTRRLLHRCGGLLMDGLAAALAALIRDATPAEGGRVSGQTAKAMGRRLSKSFSQVLMDAGKVHRRPPADRPCRGIRPAHGVSNRHRQARRAGKGSGPVGAIDGIHPCDVPCRVHKIDRIASLD